MVSSASSGTTHWYCTKPRGPYSRFQAPTPSSGWKNVEIDWISPLRCRGALWYQASLKARTVAGRTRPPGRCGGAASRGLAGGDSGCRTARPVSSARVACSPWESTDRPRLRPRARVSIQATE